jgi:hypothetical protein
LEISADSGTNVIDINSSVIDVDALDDFTGLSCAIPDDSKDWEFLNTLSVEHRNQYPDFIGNEFIIPDVQSVPLQHEGDQCSAFQRPPIHPRKMKNGASPGIDISCVSANVLTLDPQHERKVAKSNGLCQKGRVHYLQDQCHNLKLHLVGIQEARTDGPDVRTGESYIAFTSGATSRGQFGCELWVNTKLSFVPDDNVKFKLECATVVLTDPRFLLVALRFSSVQVDCLVMHAPHSAHGETKIR